MTVAVTLEVPLELGVELRIARYLMFSSNWQQLAALAFEGDWLGSGWGFRVEDLRQMRQSGTKRLTVLLAKSVVSQIDEARAGRPKLSRGLVALAVLDVMLERHWRRSRPFIMALKGYRMYQEHQAEVTPFAPRA